MENIATITSSESSSKNCLVSTATETDLSVLGEMGHHFAGLYGEGLMNFKTEVFLEKMRQFVRTQTGIVLCAHQGWDLRGALAGVTYENVFDGELCASELFWYVWPGAQKGAGTMLLDAFEDWARFRKCTRVTMAAMHHNKFDSLGRYYARRGYKAFETQYVKLL